MGDNPLFKSNTYSGTPKEIIVKISEELAQMLAESGRPPNGLTVLAMLHVAACMVKAGNDAAAVFEANDLGIMPSFKSSLAVLVHGLLASDWTTEELIAFDQDFVRIIESLGGTKLPKSGDVPPIMAPMSNVTH